MKNIFIIPFMAWSSLLIGQQIIVKPYLQDMTSQSVKIMWETDTAIDGMVLYGVDPFNLSDSISSIQQVGNNATRINTANLQNLFSFQKYYYRIKLASGTKSALYSFKTYKLQTEEQDINLVAVSDIQMQPAYPLVYKNIVEQGIIPVCDTALNGTLENLHGIIIPGDLVQNGGVYSEWKNTFFDKADSLTTKIPLYPVLGNHEYYSNGLPNFLKYFDLPLNGDASAPEQWWYKDFSNIRLIGLNSNSGTADQNLQLTWLQTKLDSACVNPLIDFVFVQLHHPYKSELWTPGESNFTGQVVQLLETFTHTCAKPSVHFFGHTHAYSRGQSKEHQHLWVNVAVAGGAIDNWGEYPNADYPEFSISEDKFGFVLIETKAGYDPQMRIRRYSRGDESMVENNINTDDLTVKKYEFGPKRPLALFPNIGISTNCVKLKANIFFDPENFHQASQWQVATDINFNSIVADVWKQHMNWYNEVNTQANDDLTDQEIDNLQENTSYYWRVRYRDNFLKWSEWSFPMNFTTTANSAATGNLILNNGAESSVDFWSGQIESLLSDECNSVPVYVGQKFFAVGGVCTNESNIGIAFQNIDVSSYSSLINQGNYVANFGAYMRAYANNNDLPEMYIECYNQANTLLATSNILSNNTSTWTLKSSNIVLPVGTWSIKVILKGTRLSGTDNDSYFDELSLYLSQNSSCANCFGVGQDQDLDGFCINLDCNDNNAQIHPGKIETCNNIDDDCDGLVDTGDHVTWVGNGVSNDWNEGKNWSQQFVPLPCQHVIIPNNASVIIHNNHHYVKSIEVNQNAQVTINNNGQLTLNAQGSSTVTANIVGSMINNGRMIIKKSNSNGLVINGTFQNNGIVSIEQIGIDNILIMPTGSLNNIGLINNK